MSIGRSHRIRLAIVDDHPIVLDGLEKLFALERDFEVVARCRDAGEAMREIVSRVARGMRNRAIAEELGISEGTVKLHLDHVYEKLGLGGRVSLLLYAQKHGL